jgi:hypothetical protein
MGATPGQLLLLLGSGRYGGSSPIVLDVLVLAAADGVKVSLRRCPVGGRRLQREPLRPGIASPAAELTELCGECCPGAALQGQQPQPGCLQPAQLAGLRDFG